MNIIPSTLKECPKSGEDNQLDTISSYENNDQDSLLTEGFEGNERSVSVVHENIHSINYDEDSIDDNDNVKDQLADAIISSFIVKRPKRFIDTDSITDEVSYEESEVRLILLFTFLSVIVAFVASTLSVWFGFKVFEVTLTNPWRVLSNKNTVSYPTNQFIVMDSSGDLESLQLTSSNKLEVNYKLKLPERESYFLLADKRNIFVFKAKKERVETNFKVITNFEMEVTKLILKSGTNMVIPHRKLQKAYDSMESCSLRVGNTFWILGKVLDEKSQNGVVWSDFNQVFKLGSSFWNLKKHVWFQGPRFNLKSTESNHGFCGTPVNRSHGLVFNYREASDFNPATTLITNISEKCVDLYILNVLNYNLTRHSCLISFDHSQFDNVLLPLSCSSLDTKAGKR